MPKPRDRSFALGATVFVVAVIALGFYNSGSPRVQRQMAIDRARVDRLRAIVQEIHNRTALPASLEDIKLSYVRITDPETDAVLNTIRPIRRTTNCVPSSTPKVRIGNRSQTDGPAGRIRPGGIVTRST